MFGWVDGWMVGLMRWLGEIGGLVRMDGWTEGEMVEWRDEVGYCL